MYVKTLNVKQLLLDILKHSFHVPENARKIIKVAALKTKCSGDVIEAEILLQFDDWKLPLEP